MIYVKEDIPSKQTKISNSKGGIFIELNLHKKRILCGSCNPNKTFISKHLNITSKNLYNPSSKYDNVFLIGDFDIGNQMM